MINISQDSRPTGLEVNPCAWTPGFCDECLGCHLEQTPQTRTPSAEDGVSCPSHGAENTVKLVPTALPAGIRYRHILPLAVICVDMLIIGARLVSHIAEEF